MAATSNEGMVGGAGAPTTGEPLLDDGGGWTETRVVDAKLLTTAKPLAIQRALREVEAAMDVELVGLLGKLDELRETEDELQGQVEQALLELSSLQDSLSDNTQSVRKMLQAKRALAGRRANAQATAMQRALLTDAADLRERARLWSERQDARRRRQEAFEADPQLAEKLKEYQSLDEGMDTLRQLPESYQKVVKQHHAELEEELSDYLSEDDDLGAHRLNLSLAVAVLSGRTEDGSPDPASCLVRALVPVDQPTWRRGQKAADPSLPSRFAQRFVDAMTRFAQVLGCEATPKVKDLDGLLGVALHITDMMMPSGPGDLARALRDSFRDTQQDEQLARLDTVAELVVVPMSAMKVVWIRCSSEATERVKTTQPVPSAVN